MPVMQPFTLDSGRQPGTSYADLPIEMQQEAMAIARKRAISEALLGQGLGSPTNINETVSGRVVPYSSMQGIAQIAKALGGSYGLYSAGKDTKALSDKYNTGLADAVANYSKQRAGSAGYDVGANEMGDEGYQVAAKVPDPRGAVTSAIMSQYAPLKALAARDDVQANRMEDRQAARDDRPLTAVEVEQAEQAHLLKVRGALDRGEVVSPEDMLKAKMIQTKLTQPKATLAGVVQPNLPADLDITKVGLPPAVPPANVPPVRSPTSTAENQIVARNDADALTFMRAQEKAGNTASATIDPLAPALSPESRITVTPTKEPALTNLTEPAKLGENLRKGLITQDVYNAGMAAWLARGEKHVQDAKPTGGDIKAQGAMIVAGVPMVQAVPGFGKAAVVQRNAAQEEAVRQLKEQNPNMTSEQAGAMISDAMINRAAGGKSVGQLTTMLGATRQAVDQLDFNVKKTTEKLDELGLQGVKDLSPAINAIANGVQKWTGDPKYGSAFFYMHAAAMESARILQGGQASIAQLHTGAAEEAKKWASMGMTTPATWKEEVGPAILAEGRERLLTYERAIAKQRPGGGQPAPSGGMSIEERLKKYQR